MTRALLALRLASLFVLAATASACTGSGADAASTPGAGAGAGTGGGTFSGDGGPGFFGAGGAMPGTGGRGQGGDAQGGGAQGGGGGASSVCGDGVVGTGETCDDGNAKPGDGCSGVCRTEPNYTCTTPGQPCTSTVVCGDGMVTGNEACDDGNTVSGDGCSANCQAVEPGYACATPGAACKPTSKAPLCGDGIVDAGESCDDGGTLPNDGCSPTCQLEAGWHCPQPGMACARDGYCGDGSLNGGEACDDGNMTSGDGCSASCQLEANFACGAPGTMCVSTVVCGDGKVTGSETCDDGNMTSGDGCSATCHVEPGWVCPPGGVCKAAACGDGYVVSPEQCDDGNTTDGDGCSAKCTLESATATERDGWICLTPGAPCTRTTCGNGVREGSEQCDDGNNDAGDGCTPFCRNEPVCPASGGACSTACGDGLLLPIDKLAGQECDDGNTVSGDGCSAACKIEPGYACVDTAVTQNPLILPIILRDFKANGETNGHPDFESYAGQGDPGIVKTQLGLTGKPEHVNATKVDEANQYDSAGVLTSPEDYFASWYRDNAAYNKTILQTLSFGQVAGGGYQYASSAFFPIDNLGWGNYANTGHNFSFTSEVRYWFAYQGGEQLDFTGDDDVWVFINKQLAVDLGGLHSAKSGSLALHATSGDAYVCDFVTPDCNNRRTLPLGLVLGSVYEIVVFQAERHTTASNYRLTLSNFVSTRSTCSSVCGDAIATPDEACDLGTAKNTGAYGTCNPNCTRAPSCGDAIVNGPEQCDDGVNLAAYGGATKVCGPGCVFAPYCGDGHRDATRGEACDAGAQNSNTAYGMGQCTKTCRAAPFCGDRAVDGAFGESCDDGVNSGKPGSCATNCSAFIPSAACGNGTLDTGEQCDDGVNNGAPSSACDVHCRHKCGNGFKEGTEQCDDGINNGVYGTCTSMCTLAGYCGDGVVNGPEQCDAGSANAANPYGKGACSTSCTNAPFCGDGVVQAAFGEECDGGSACGVDCIRIGPH